LSFWIDNIVFKDNASGRSQSYRFTRDEGLEWWKGNRKEAFGNSEGELQSHQGRIQIVRLRQNKVAVVSDTLGSPTEDFSLEFDFKMEEFNPDVRFWIWLGFHDSNLFMDNSLRDTRKSLDHLIQGDAVGVLFLPQLEWSAKQALALGGSTHNVYLDWYRYGGALPATFFALFIAGMFSASLWFLFKNRHHIYFPFFLATMLQLLVIMTEFYGHHVLFVRYAWVVLGMTMAVLVSDTEP
jgi:hypothetical protein